MLQSENHPEHFYVGHTDDLRQRLKRHNAGEVPHTSKLRPWRIKTAIAFTDPDQAIRFERYLKTSRQSFRKETFVISAFFVHSIHGEKAKAGVLDSCRRDGGAPRFRSAGQARLRVRLAMRRLRGNR
ncbi:MAG TPA: GIY-YIG nuclease family protein [Verrucomicrobiae bacterium]|nr:GIY-YIG nuclease family protein [Verrucomicrobiae bacterium]